MVVRLLSSGMYDKKKILRDNPNVIDVSSGTKRERLAKARSIKSSSSSSELNYTPAPEADLKAAQNYTPANESRSLLQRYWDYRKNQIDVKAVTGAYNFVDRYLFGGRLAGGQSELDVVNEKTLNNQNLIDAEGALYDAQLARLRQDILVDMQKDLLNKSWYENLGIGYSDNEKFLRNLFDMQASAIENANQLPKTASSIERYETVIRETPNAANIISAATPQSTDWGKIALIGGLGIVGIMALSKGMRG